MNKLIKELAEQAWDYAEETWTEPYGDMYDLCLEKFAELIVKECATLAYDGPNGILEHFGVKR